MWPKSIILTLCLSFFLFSLALLAGPTQMVVANAAEHQVAEHQTAQHQAAQHQAAQHQANADVVDLAAASAPRAMPAEHHRLLMPQPTLRNTSPWGVWGKALQRTRQLLWMLTRPGRMLRDGALALV